MGSTGGSKGGEARKEQMAAVSTLLGILLLAAGKWPAKIASAISMCLQGVISTPGPSRTLDASFCVSWCRCIEAEMRVNSTVDGLSQNPSCCPTPKP